MTRITLAFLSALAIGGVTLPSHASEGVPTAAPGPMFGGGWADSVTGEAGGAFDPRFAAPIHGGGQPAAVTGEAGGSFSRDLAVRLGVQQNAEGARAPLIAAQRS